MKKNLLIALEGIDGCGKTTQIKLLSDFLRANGHTPYCTAEPTQQPIGRMIRELFRQKEGVDHRIVAGYFVADRLQHILDPEEGMMRKLEDGYSVITDRYYFSSYAYQGSFVDLEWVMAANALSASLLKPDLHIYIDIDPEVSMQRLQLGRNDLELYESLEYLKKIRTTYLQSFERAGTSEPICIIPGHKSVEEVASEIRKAVSSL